MPFSLENYIFFGNPTPDSARFVRTDSVVSHRKDVTVSRRTASYNSKTGETSIPEYRITIRKDAQVGDPVAPNGQRLTFDLVMRTPIQPSQADLDEAINELSAILSDPELKSTVLTQVFPCIPCESENE